MRGEPFCKKVPPRTPLQKLLYPVRCVASAGSGSHTAGELWSFLKGARGKLFYTKKFPPENSPAGAVGPDALMKLKSNVDVSILCLKEFVRNG